MSLVFGVLVVFVGFLPCLSGCAFRVWVVWAVWFFVGWVGRLGLGVARLVVLGFR